jgi:hypothetical protein
MGYPLVSLDIECSDLKADLGLVIVAAVKPLGDDYPDRHQWEDVPLLSDLFQMLAHVEKAVGWYSSLHDLPFLRTRRVLQGMEPGPLLRHSDLYFAAKNHLRLHSNRLAAVAQHFSTHRTVEVEVPVWVRAAYGDREAIDKVARKCVADVRMTEDVGLALKDWVKTENMVQL